MSEMETSNSVVKAKGGRGTQMAPGVAHGPPGTGGPQQQQQDMDFMSFQQQEFNSWRNPPPPPHHATGDYNNFNYYGAAAAAGGYSPFSPGDIRDSIAAIWSRTSPSGEGVPLGGAYGQFPPPPPPPPHPDGQFNHLGHFPHGDLSGLFADQYGGFPYGYGYTQWPDNSNGNRNNGGGSSSNPGYSYLGSSGSGAPLGGSEDPRSSSMSRNNINAANMNNNNNELLMSQLMENTKISSPNQPPVSIKGKMMDTNGYNGSSNMSGSSSSIGAGVPTKKMSWAKVASQPAKPTATSSKTKKPGVLSPPAIIPMSSSKGVPPTAVDPVPSPSFSNSQGPSPVNNNHSEPSVSNGNTSNSNGNMKSVMQQQQQQTSNHRSQIPNYGPRGHRGGLGKDHHSNSNAPSSSSNGPRAGGNNTGSTSESHPVLESLRSTNEYNPKNFDLNPIHARYFVLKSFCEDDIHRSIKFEIWCSTQHGNKRLDTAWNEQLGVGPIYLFFSVNGSGHFCGMAQMLTGVDYSSTANSVWVQDKFKGQFKVKWIYVKDVPNNQLRHILLENNENKPVTKSRDTQEVPSEKGQMLLKVMHGFKHTTCIFDDFAHYERRQEAEESKKNERQQQQHHHHDKSHDKNRDNSARESRNKNPWDWEMNNASNWE